MLRVAPELQSLPSVRHGFTGREGGVSTGPLATLNLALREGETEQALRENWRRVAAALHPELSAANVVLLDQVHAGDVVVAREPSGPFATLAAADAVVTDVEGLVLAIRTADCVPVLFAGPGVVGAAHAGWRGVAARVVPHTIEALAELGAAPDQLTAVVGPHISVEAYEVGDEVVRGIAASGVPEAVFVRQEARPHVDLRAAVVHQLEAAGVQTVGHVHGCTHTDPGYYSHRRDGPSTGRQASVIARVG